MAQWPNEQQAKNWNEQSGRTWVELQPMLDSMFAPLVPILVEAAAPKGGERALDIGCGAGATTFAMAGRVGAESFCLGVDISAPLVKHARARAAQAGVANVGFALADAQTHQFAPHAFDIAISRFGVMFFDDPVAAFGKIRRALRKDGRLAALAWRSPRENPFMTAAAQAARPFLPDLPRFEPNAPGQFGFADEEYVTGILKGSGWSSIRMDPIDLDCTLPAEDLEVYMMNMGPVASALRNSDPANRDEIVAAMREAFELYVRRGTARFAIACWMIRATA